MNPTAELLNADLHQQQERLQTAYDNHEPLHVVMALAELYERHIDLLEDYQLGRRVLH